MPLMQQLRPSSVFFGRVIAKMAFWIIEKHKEGGHHIHLLIQTDSNSKELDRAARGVSNNGTPHIQKYSDTDHQFNYVLSKMNVGLNEHGYVIDGIVC